MNHRSVRWLWERSVDLAALFGFLTVVSSVSMGRTTFESSTIRNFAIGQMIPGIAGQAQVNTWATYLLAGAGISIIYLFRGLAETRIRSLVAFTAIVTSSVSVMMSSSRANTAALVVMVAISVVVLMRGQLQVRTQHRLILRVAGVSFAVVAVAATVYLATNNARFNVKADVGVAGQFDGRSERMAAMLDDIMASPLVGTGFADFALRQPELTASSPHNQWVGALHKLGIPLGLVYIYMVFRAFVPATLTRFSRPLSISVVLLVGLVGCVYDVLTAVPSGAWLLLLPGFLQHSTTVVEKVTVIEKTVIEKTVIENSTVNQNTVVENGSVVENTVVDKTAVDKTAVEKSRPSYEFAR